jgi:general secretion pathway protein F
MAEYAYKAATVEGKVVEGRMEAPDQGIVSLRLQEMSLIPIRVGAAAKSGVLSKEIPWPWKRRRVRRRDLLVFTHELHTLVRSGIPLDRSLAVLAKLAESPTLGEVIQDVLRKVKEGKSFSEALGDHPGAFPKVYVNMVHAGEVGGVLEDILGRLTTFLETSENLRSYVVSALIYPALLSVVAVGSITVMTMFVVPKFSAVFVDMGVPLPLPMVILQGLSNLLNGYWWLLLGSMLLVGFYLNRFHKNPEGRLKWDRWLLRIPMWGPVVRKIEVARFARTLGTLLHSGVPLLQGMNIVREILSNQGIASTIEPIRNGIKKGEGIAQPMKQSGVFPPLAMHLIEVGEESGKLDTMLIQVAEVYDVEVKNAIKNLIAFFEPALILAMGLIIGTIVVSMMLAIFSINDMPM